MVYGTEVWWKAVLDAVWRSHMIGFNWHQFWCWWGSTIAKMTVGKLASHWHFQFIQPWKLNIRYNPIQFWIEMNDGNGIAAGANFIAPWHPPFDFVDELFQQWSTTLKRTASVWPLLACGGLLLVVFAMPSVAEWIYFWRVGAVLWRRVMYRFRWNVFVSPIAKQTKPNQQSIVCIIVFFFLLEEEKRG